ncbi:MAG: hypothetical protein ACE5IA_01315 [Dehalococcoidia bacterium]
MITLGMGSIADIAGLIALFITLLMWFGVTPKTLAVWTRKHKVVHRLLADILPILLIVFAVFDGAYHIWADPYNLGQNRWFYASFWIVWSFVLVTYVIDRYIRDSYSRSILLFIIRVLLIAMAWVLFVIGLSLPMQQVLIMVGVFAGTMATGTIVALLMPKSRSKKIAK